MSDVERVGEFLDALDAARTAKAKFETNDGDNYDPCGHTARWVKREYEEAARALRVAASRLPLEVT